MHYSIWKPKKQFTEGTDGNFCAITVVGDNNGGDVGPDSAGCVLWGGDVADSGDEAGGGLVPEDPRNNRGTEVVDGETSCFFFLFIPPEKVDCCKASINTLLSWISCAGAGIKQGNNIIIRFLNVWLKLRQFAIYKYG